MESTGVYWKPVYHVLEGTVELLLVNAQHIKAVPGRKTDVKDCEWIADLLAHGLLRASFVPPLAIRAVREVTRYRKALIRERATAVNRLHKILETANIKLASVVSDVLGVTGRAILQALIAGERDPARLAGLARGSLSRRRSALAEAVVGRVERHHVFVLSQVLGQVAHLETAIAACDAQVAAALAEASPHLERLGSIPGVGRRAAEVILSEIGVDMTRFPTAAHLASWAKICPGNHESAGKRLSGRTGRGNGWLRAVLIEAAWAASRSKGTYLGAQFRRLMRRRGPKKAVLAVAHSILVAVFYILRDGVEYRELGADYFDRLGTTRLLRYHVRRLEELGHRVTLEPVAG